PLPALRSAISDPSVTAAKTPTLEWARPLLAGPLISPPSFLEGPRRLAPGTFSYSRGGQASPMCPLRGRSDIWSRCEEATQTGQQSRPFPLMSLLFLPPPCGEGR